MKFCIGAIVGIFFQAFVDYGRPFKINPWWIPHGVVTKVTLGDRVFECAPEKP